MKEIKKYHDNGQIREHYWIDENNKKQDEYKYWYRDGQLCEHCFYKNNEAEGQYLSLNRNGQLWEHCFYRRGLLEGEYKQWHENGQICVHNFYHNDEAVDITEYATDINNITKEEYFHLQITFGYFPIFKFDGKFE